MPFLTIAYFYQYRINKFNNEGADSCFKTLLLAYYILYKKATLMQRTFKSKFIDMKQKAFYDYVISNVRFE